VRRISGHRRRELQFAVGGQRRPVAGSVPGEDVFNLAAIAGAVEFNGNLGDTGFGKRGEKKWPYCGRGRRRQALWVMAVSLWFFG
jgi:hypothetical protein